MKKTRRPTIMEELIGHMSDVGRYQRELDNLDMLWGFISSIAEMTCPAEALTILPTMQKTQEGFETLEDQLIENLILENLRKVILDITSKAQVVVDVVIRNLYERTADVGFLATDDEICSFVSGNISQESIIQRLNEYRNKYTVYDEIIILDIAGNVLANLDPDNNISSSKDELLIKTINSDSYLESFKKTDLRPSKNTALIYSQRIQKSETGEVIGVLCLCFKFENEMEGIFSSLRNKGDRSIMLLLDHEGFVIASNNEDSVKINKRFEVTDNEEYTIVDHVGREYLAVTCKTRGYQGFFGLGWLGHVMIPIDSAFKTSINLLENVDPTILNNIMRYADSFCPALNEIVLGADQINLSLRRVVWNGQIMSAGKKGDLARLKSILKQISKNGEKTREIFEDSINNLYETVISSSLSDVKFIARLMIDIMDRNLYERANDCRWWALTHDIRKVLSEKNDTTDEDMRKITDILVLINSLYTVYTRIFIYDSSGTIIASSNLHNENLNIIGKKYDSTIISQVFKLGTTQDYVVSGFSKTGFYGNHETYIYNAAIRSLVNDKDIVGGIGIVFDSGPEFKAMLSDNIPKRSGSFGVFTDRSGNIISTTSDDYPIGSRMIIDPEFFSLPNGEGISKIVILRQKYYIVGCMTSFGYREYKNSGEYKNDVVSLVFVPIGEVKEMENEKKVINYSSGTIKGNETLEFATFIVDEKVYALPASSVVEAVEATRITMLPNSKPYIAGTISFSNTETGKDIVTIVPVICPRTLFGGKTKKKNDPKTQIIIVRTGKGLIGILVDDLDSVPEFDATRLEKVPLLISTDSGYIQSIIKPELSGSIDDMLMVIDPDIFIEAVKK